MASAMLSAVAISCVVSATALALGGCADPSALSAWQGNSRFEEIGGGFRFTAVMNAQYPADDPKAEALRQRWLDANLVSSNRCSDGNASVVDRKVIVTGKEQDTGKPVGKIVYWGDCG